MLCWKFMGEILKITWRDKVCQAEVGGLDIFCIYLGLVYNAKLQQQLKKHNKDKKLKPAIFIAIQVRNVV